MCPLFTICRAAVLSLSGTRFLTKYITCRAHGPVLGVARVAALDRSTQCVKNSRNSRSCWHSVDTHCQIELVSSL